MVYTRASAKVGLDAAAHFVRYRTTEPILAADPDAEQNKRAVSTLLGQSASPASFQPVTGPRTWGVATSELVHAYSIRLVPGPLYQVSPTLAIA